MHSVNGTGCIGRKLPNTAGLVRDKLVRSENRCVTVLSAPETAMKAAERRAVPRVGGDEREKGLGRVLPAEVDTRKRSGASRLRQSLSRVWS